MKKLLLIRHAKSSWNFTDLEDFDRPLNDRGNRDAPMMAKRLLSKQIDIDKIVSSPAVRALTTAELFAKQYNIKHKHIVQVEELYEASMQNFFNIISNFDDDDKTVAVFSHNPGITDFANAITQTRIDNIPTCGIFAVKADIKQWSEFADAKKEFWFFDYPKSED